MTRNVRTIAKCTGTHPFLVCIFKALIVAAMNVALIVSLPSRLEVAHP